MVVAERLTEQHSCKYRSILASPREGESFVGQGDSPLGVRRPHQERREGREQQCPAIGVIDTDDAEGFLNERDHARIGVVEGDTHGDFLREERRVGQPRDKTAAPCRVCGRERHVERAWIRDRVQCGPVPDEEIAPDGASSIFVQGAPLRQPNGIAFDQQSNIVVVNVGNNEVLTFSRSGQLLKTENAVQAGNDGLVIMRDGTKYVSSVLNGGVSRIRPGKAAELIARNIPSAASMCYDAGANQLVIPMNANNGLAFVRLE